MKSLTGAVIAAAGIAVGLAQQPTTAPTSPTVPNSTTPPNTAPTPNAATSSNSAERFDGSKSLTPDERSFIQETLNDGRQEVELGHMALRQGSSEAVKEYAQRLINDHNEANIKLGRIAKEFNIPDQNGPPVSPAFLSVQQELGRLDGKAFDRAFAQQMVADHMKAVSKFESSKLMAMNTELRAFIDSTLPTLKEHLDHARELQ